MPKRKELLVNGEIYHVYNRSVSNLEIFSAKREFSRAFELLNFYRFEQLLKFSKFKTLSSKNKNNYLEQIKKGGPMTEIYSYALMPDHYHLLLKQLKDDGIKKFISNFQNGFAKYFNIKNENRGSIFINPFKAKRVTSDEILLHVSRYIHLNPSTSYLIEFEDLKNSPRTSFPYYLEERKNDFITSEFILSLFGKSDKRNNYFNFVTNQADYQRKLRLIKNFLLENI